MAFANNISLSINSSFTIQGNFGDRDSSPLNPLEVCSLKQVHSTKIYQIHNTQDLPKIKGQEGDGILSTLSGTTLAIRTADCVPILLAHPDFLVGALHAGWRGTSQGILERALLRIQSLGLNLKKLRVWIGPAICQDCYEVGEEVAKEFHPTKFGTCLKKGKSTGKFQLDLKSANQHLALSLGVRQEKLSVSVDCTSCNIDYYSYRRSQRQSMVEIGRNWSWIMGEDAT